MLGYFRNLIPLFSRDKFLIRYREEKEHLCDRGYTGMVREEDNCFRAA